MGQATLNQKTSDFGTFGRYTEIPVDQMTSEQRRGYELVVQERGEAPGPYKIFIQNPHLLHSSTALELASLSRCLRRLVEWFVP